MSVPPAAMWRIRSLSAQSRIRCSPAPARSEAGYDRFNIVTLSSMSSADEELQVLSMVFVSSEESIELRAGQDGLEVLVLQFQAETASSLIEPVLTGTL